MILKWQVCVFFFSRLSQIWSKQCHVSITHYGTSIGVVLCSLWICYFVFFSGVASPCKHFLLTSQQRQWPLNPGSANRREASCGFLWILEKENVLLFFNVFYSFCFWDVDLRGCVASLTSYSHLSFVADFVSLWVWKLLKNICTQRLSRTGQSGPRRKRNGTQ